MIFFVFLFVVASSATGFVLLACLGTLVPEEKTRRTDHGNVVVRTVVNQFNCGLDVLEEMQLGLTSTGYEVTWKGYHEFFRYGCEDECVNFINWLWEKR